jgi:GNAT superfamily N-acetyltransferase
VSLSSETSSPPLGDLSPIEPLTAAHVVEGFDCGQIELNTWLVKYALQNNSAAGSRTRVVSYTGEERRVVGFYALSAGAVAKLEAPARVAKGKAAHPIPVIVLTRLGVDLSMQGKGLGTALLKDALLRVLEISDVVGVRALLVHAKDDGAAAFYSQFDFEPSPVAANQLLMLVKDIKALF